MSIITLKNKVKKWMLNNYSGYVDPMTGELNATSLAEAASDQYDLYHDHISWEIPEEVFSWSVEISEQVK